MTHQEILGWRVGTTDEGEHIAYRNQDGLTVTIGTNRVPDERRALLVETSRDVSIPVPVLRALLQLAGAL